MSKFSSVFPARRFGPLAQAALIRTYKVIGLVALTGILVGLICFLSVNLFYLVNRSWVRPVVLSPTHTSVLNAMATLSGESSRRDELVGERDQLKAELVAIDKVLQIDAALERDYAHVAADLPGGLHGPVVWQALVARRAYAETIIERERSASRQDVIERQIERLDKTIARYDKLVEQIQASAYIQATDKQVTVAFVPYENLDNVEEGMSIYACRWGLIWCRNVGTVGPQLNGEVTDNHPQTGNSLRGLMIEIRLEDAEATEERALFVGKRPFWIL